MATPQLHHAPGRDLDDLLGTPLGNTRDEPALRRDKAMKEQERTAFEALSDQLTVYRGSYRSNKLGLSWSLERD